MKEFLWGGATSASQYEGGKSTKGLDTQDCRPYLPRTSNATVSTRLLTEENMRRAESDDKNEAYYPFRVGTKGYEHCDEDLNYLIELGISIYRFSISWSRLFPNGIEKEPDPDGVEYYDHIFRTLREHDIRIFLVLNHYAIPVYLVEKYGGWRNKKTIEYYLKLVRFVFDRWGEYIDYYLPFNEINAGYFSPYNGVGLPKPSEGDYVYQDVFQSLHNQFTANAMAIKTARDMNIRAKSCCMISCFCYYPLTSSPEDNYKLIKDEQMNQWFCADVMMTGEYPYYAKPFFEEHDVHLDFSDEERDVLKKYTCDVMSFSYYSSSVVSVDESEQTAGNLVATVKNPYLKASDWGWQIDPLGLRTTLNKCCDRYKCPIIVAENGLGAHDKLEYDGSVHDQYRITYMDSHFKEILAARDVDNVDVRAYMAWGIIDIISAGSCEMDKRYGVIYVDADNEGNGTYKRYKKDSFYWYKDFIANQKRIALETNRRS